MNSTRVEVLKSKLEKFEITYVYINDKTSFAKIYDLFINDIMFEPINGMENNYLGLYFRNIKKDYNKAKCHYLIAIERGNTVAIHNLADLYMETKDYDNAEHYYLMAVKYNTNSFNGLAWFYNNIKKDFINAEIYYKIAASHGNILPMNNLACFYYKRGNYVDAKVYSLMAIKHGNVQSINILMNCYKINENTVELINLFTKYHDFIKRTKIIYYVGQIWNSELYFDEYQHLVKFLLFFEFQTGDDIPTSLKTFAKMLKNKLIIIKLHFDYGIDGPGFHDAKNDFDSRNLCYN